MYGGNTESIAINPTGEIAVKKKKKTKRELEEEALREMYGEEDGDEDAKLTGSHSNEMVNYDGTGELRGQLGGGSRAMQHNNNQMEDHDDNGGNVRLQLPTLGGAGEKIFADPDPNNNSFAVNNDEDYFVNDFGDGSYGDDFEDDFDRPSDFEQKKKARPSSANRTGQRGGEGGGFTGL